MKKKIRAKNFDFKKQEGKIVHVFVAAFLLYLIFIIFADIHKMRSVSLTFHWVLIPITMIFLLCNYMFRSLRFYYLLRKIGIRFSLRETLSIFFAGIAMTATPGKIGEAVKSYLIKQKTGYGYSRTIPLLIFERVMDGLAMIVLSLGGLYFFQGKAVVIFFLFSGSLVIVFFTLILYRRPVIIFFKFIEKRFHLKIIGTVNTFFDHAQIFMKTGIISISLILSIVAWAFQGISLYLLVNSIVPASFSLSFAQGVSYAFFVFSFSSIVGFLAFIPAGIGVAEGSLISFLVLFFHITFTQAVFISLIFRFTTLWFGVGLGLLFFIRMLRVRPFHSSSGRIRS